MQLAEALAIAGPFLALGLSAAGTATGMGKAASSAVGVVSAEPRYFTLALVMAFLPSTQTLVYGLGFAFLVYSQVLAAGGELSMLEGAGILSISVFVGLAELSSAYWQGVVCADTIAMLPRTRGAILSRGIVLAAYIEFVGLLGLVLGYLFVGLLAG